ncbi:DUF6082 family protein [Verrucosispora sp. NA02020]|uniref:DUF6082 family protein n=1 Tax=unclassified Micromonospora TaxID=2617518 RepID=UPI001590C6E3|nr:DUF6082 family protein [Verrucosispora sp. NA02020]QKW13731.1 hypothetical protein HUT12_13690 [Verrucosispora sp. NA02020]
MVTDLARRSMTPTVLLLAVLAILAAVLLSPAGLLWIGERPGYDWSLLGNVGEAYGAASAILAGLALMGVAISLIIQAREAKAAREQALRALHTDLLKMAIDDPGLLECWGPIEQSTDLEWFRKHVYTNLIVSHWQLMWEVDLLSEDHLEVLADQFFKGMAGRRFWAEARGPRMKAETSRRARRFTLIVDRSYQAAVTAGPPADATDGRSSSNDRAVGPDPHESQSGRPQSRAVDLALGAVLGGGVALAARYLVRHGRATSGEG